MEGFELVAILSLIVIFGVAILAYWKITKGKRLSKSKKDFFRQTLAKIQMLPFRDQIVQCDILLDQILTSLGYSGTLGEKLKKNPSVIESDINIIWRLHKLRNTLVHSFEPQSEVLIKKEGNAYGRLIQNLLQKL